MRSVDFDQRNRLYKSQDADSEIFDLPVFTDGVRTISCWEFNKEDLEEINRTGKLWVIHLGDKIVPFELFSESPFRVPRPITVGEKMAGRVTVAFFEDKELVLLSVGKGEYGFEIESVGRIYDKVDTEFYALTMHHTSYPMNQEFDTDYIFGEPLKVIGLATEHYGRFDVLAKKYNIPPEQLLILERINKTEK